MNPYVTSISHSARRAGCLLALVLATLAGTAQAQNYTVTVTTDYGGQPVEFGSTATADRFTTSMKDYQRFRQLIRWRLFLVFPRIL